MLGNFISVLQFNNISIERTTLKLFDFKTKELYNLYRMEMFLIITKNKKRLKILLMSKTASMFKIKVLKYR